MDVNLIRKQKIQTDVEVKFIENFIGDCEERVALNIQVNRNISLVSHLLINFFNLVQNFQLFFLSLNIANKIFFLFCNNSFRLLFLLVLLCFYIFSRLWNNFVAGKISFGTVVALNKLVFWILYHFFWVIWPNKWMFEHLRPWDSLLFRDCQHSTQKVLNLLRSLNVFRKFEFGCSNVFQKLLRTFGIVWGPSVQNLENCNTQRPNIAFWAEFLLGQNLRSHIKRRT